MIGVIEEKEYARQVGCVPVEYTEDEKNATTLWAIYYVITEQYDRTLTDLRKSDGDADILAQSACDREVIGKSGRFAKRAIHMISQRAAGIEHRTWRLMGEDVIRWRHEDQMAYLRRDPDRWALYREVRGQAGFR